MHTSANARFREEYAAHRAAEGRAYSGEQLRSLPYLDSGPLARQWAVRARSYEVFMHAVLTPLALRAGRPLSIVDLGAGNGWLSRHMAHAGHKPIAIDIRTDDVDGLGAARFEESFPLVAASFDELPLQSESIDLAVFNASLHYAQDLSRTIAEAVRILRPHGTIAIIDSPFYRLESEGQAMVAEKLASGDTQFGSRVHTLLEIPFIEFLTRERLARASATLGLQWQRHRVRYPLWYELRPFTALLHKRRAPSRFDVWQAMLP